MAIATSAQLARALYDNTAESPQELSFRRGDVLRSEAPSCWPSTQA
uniref:Embryonal Fyn-associated substrate n=1 Tax=Mus musculus TaxID=10090 RepID=A0A2I3BQ52_MOUSE